MNLIDITIIAIFCLTIFWGLKEGFIRNFFEFLGIILASVAAYFCSTGLLPQYFTNMAPLLAATIRGTITCILWIIVFFVINSAGNQLHAKVEKTFLRWINMFLALLLGLVEGALLSLLFITLLLLLARDYRELRPYTKESLAVKITGPSIKKAIKDVKLDLHKHSIPDPKINGKTPDEYIRETGESLPD